MTKANICFKSNVYPISRDKPLEDKTFRDKVQDREALRKMFKFLTGAERNDWSYWEDLRAKGVKEWQLLSYKNGNYCAVHNHCATPWGIVQTPEGPAVECRCEQIHRCEHAARGNCRG